MKIVALGDRTVTLLCRLGGVAETIRCEDFSSAEAALKELLMEESVAIVLIQDRYVRPLIPMLEEHGRSHRVYPVVVEIPGPKGPVKGDDTITEAIRRVAGRGMPG
ncbi:V-type ATP synthase subunit F [Methanocalculus taiwanensis]|uniref:V-type ATP synthase subunit F n=1 Tax=Methanocalculus taiwanensis TaxID=106207 RepID=UPI002101BAAC